MRDLYIIPGIGKKSAYRIWLYRLRKGTFRGVMCLQKVQGLSKKSLEKALPYISFGIPSEFRDTTK